MHKDTIHILGIESSCDDTSAAVLRNDKVLANISASQSVHAEFGGVVPELASRAHMKHIIPVISAAVAKSGIEMKDLDAIAYTRGPGLLGSLLVGTSFAKSMSLALNIPLIDINHMAAHISAHFIDQGVDKPEFPFLNLTVSGGHTQLILVRDYDRFEVIGQTIDDAAGEAFDKTAKMLQLPYPGGPEIDRMAQTGDPNSFQFSKPKIDGLDFSFSGLKTSILYTLQKEVAKNSNFVSENLQDICASVQRTIVDILLDKVERAIQQTGVASISLAGGVSANRELRQRFEKLGERLNVKTHIPKFEYCTDNGAMIGIAGYYKYLKNDFSSIEMPAQARYKL